MIEARRLRLWDGRYDLLEDGRWVATWERSPWATGGRFELGGRSFTVRANLLGDGYDYRETVSPWFRSLFYLQPKAELMTDVPIGFKLHLLIAFALFAFWPFTRLVHAFSAPVGYLTRPYVVYRSRDVRPARRGWDAPHTPRGK